MNVSGFSNTELDGHDVRCIRKTLHLSQDRFSKILNVSAVSVYLWESRGQKISPRNQKKLTEIIETMNDQKQKEWIDSTRNAYHLKPLTRRQLKLVDSVLRRN